METAILVFAIAASVIGLLLSVLYPALPSAHAGALAGGGSAVPLKDEKRLWRPLSITAAATALLLFAAALPSRPPWSIGQGLGIGIVLGAAGALVGGFLLRGVLRRVLAAEREPGPAALQLAGLFTAIGLLSLGILTAAAAFIFFRATIFDTLNGVALGALLVAVPARLGLGMGTLQGSRIGDGAASEGYALYLAALSASLAFALRHFPGSLPVALVTPLGLAAVAPIALALGAGVFGSSTSPARAFCGAGAVSAMALAGLSAVAAPGLGSEPGTRTVVLLGLVTAGLVVVLLGAAPRARHAEVPLFGLESGLLVALMLIGAFVTAFQILRGYGAGLALLAGWAVGGAGLAVLVWNDLAQLAAARWRGTTDPTAERLAVVAAGLHRALGVALLPILFRLFIEGRYRPVATDLSLTVHFTLVGLLVGATAPLLLGVMLERARQRLRVAGDAVAAEGADSPPKPPGAVGARGAARRPEAPSPVRAALLAGAGLAIWSVGVPAAVGVAWGKASLAGLLAGLLVAGVYTIFFGGARARREDAGLVASGILLGLLVMALVIVQGAHLLDPVAVMQRSTKVAALSGAALVSLVWMVLSARSTGVRQGG